MTKKTDSTKKSNDIMFLSTGSTLLDLALSGKLSGGLQCGCYYLLVGDSSSGKSFLSLTCFAEATSNPKFDDYRLIYDDVEHGALMNKERFFGSKAAKRIEPPNLVKGEPQFSSTVEEFYWNVDTATKAGKPFVYVLDSMDGLSTEDDDEQFDKQKNANGKKVSGSYGTTKAKKNSSNLRVVVNRLRETNSVLIIISQTRDNIGFGSQFNPKTRSGGKSLRFYAAAEMWTSIDSKLTKKVNGRERKIGIISDVKVKKNRIQGREPTVKLSILDSNGIDDVGSCIDFLVEEGHWTEDKKVITASDLNLSGKRETLIQKIESEGMENDLRMIVSEIWEQIEKECTPKRKQRYS